MLRNNKGFSLVELVAIIFISTLIIFPTVTALTKSYEVNDLVHRRRSAASMAQTVLFGFEKMQYPDVYNLVGNANASNTYIVTIDSTSCTQFTELDDQQLCTLLMNTVWSNISLDDTHFKVYIYDYYLSQVQINTILADASIPTEVKEKISLIVPNSSTSLNLLRITVWLDYGDEPLSKQAVSGLVFND